MHTAASSSEGGEILRIWRLGNRARLTSMKVPTRRRRNRLPESYPEPYVPVLNESPRPKAGKWEEGARRLSSPHASMKVPTRRWGNSHPKLTRNYAAETGALREPRSRPTQKVYPSSRLSIQTLLTSQNITRATHQDYVTCQVLAETDKASKGHYPHLPTSPQSNSSFLRSPAARR